MARPVSALHRVAGFVIVTFNGYQLGVSRDGVTIRIEPRWAEIPTDDFGGSGGTPSDIQHLGALAHVQCDLNAYDEAEVHKLTSFVAGGSAGIMPQIGTLMKQESKTSTLLLDGKNQDWTFDVAFPQQPQEVNKGTRFSTFVLGFTCLINNTDDRELFVVS